MQAFWKYICSPTIGKISNSNIKETRLTQLGDYMGFKYRNVNIKVDNRRAVPDAEEEVCYKIIMWYDCLSKLRLFFKAILTKYYLLFDTQISVPDYCTVEPTKRCTVELYTFSLPFMVSVHVKQEPIQLPYMLWDTAFSAESIVSIVTVNVVFYNKYKVLFYCSGPNTYAGSSKCANFSFQTSTEKVLSSFNKQA